MRTPPVACPTASHRFLASPGSNDHGSSPYPWLAQAVQSSSKAVSSDSVYNYATKIKLPNSKVDGSSWQFLGSGSAEELYSYDEHA